MELEGDTLPTRAFLLWHHLDVAKDPDFFLHSVWIRAQIHLPCSLRSGLWCWLSKFCSRECFIPIFKSMNVFNIIRSSSSTTCRRFTENQFTHPMWGFYSFTNKNKNYETMMVWFFSYFKFKTRMEIFPTCPKVTLESCSLRSVDSSPLMTTLWVDLNIKHRKIYLSYLLPNMLLMHMHAHTGSWTYTYRVLTIKDIKLSTMTSVK